MNPLPARRRRPNDRAMPSEESRAQQPILQRVGTRVQELVQGGNSAASAGTMTPSFSRQDLYSKMWTIFKHSYVNLLLVFVPAGIVAGGLDLPAEVVFWLNFLGVVPLAPLITMAVLKLSADTGPIRGGLLKNMFGNIAEMIICVLAMVNGQIRLVKWIIVGSIISYSLLVLGCSFLVASHDMGRIEFSKAQVSILSSLMMVVSISLAIPTVMSTATPQEYDDTNNTLILSHATAIVLVILFISYLFFRFVTHKTTFSYVSYNRSTANQTDHIIADGQGLLSSDWIFRLIFMSASLCVIACGHYLVHSIDVSIKRMGLTKSFVGVVLLPLMGNIGKSAAIVTTCRTRRIDFAIRAIMSNILDTMLFITPFLVLLGWIVNKPMELDFGFFEAVVFLLAIIVMTYILQHGKITYFEGVMLIGTYFVIAVTFYVRPEASETGPSLALERRLAILKANPVQLAV